MLLNKPMWSDGLDAWSDDERDEMRRGVCFGKGGSSGTPAPAPTTSTVNQSNLPDYAEPYFTDLLDRAKAASTTDYTPYGGQRIAEFDPNTTEGFNDITAQAQSGTPGEFTTATNTLTGVAEQGPMDQQAQFASMGSYSDPGVAQQYMNPYISNVLDAQTARLNQNYNEQAVARNSQAAAAGAFGGDRRFIQDSLATRDQNQQLNEMNAQGLAQAYQSGADIYGREQGVEMQNRGLNTEVFAGNQNRALTQQQNQMTASEQLRQQGLSNDDLAFNRAKMQAGVGGAYEDKQQASLDTGYADFINQRDYDRNQLNFYSGILRGVPISPQQETTTYNAPPSQMSQLLGLGIGGLGLAKAMG